MTEAQSVDLAHELGLWRQTAAQNGELATKYRAEISELLLMVARLNEGSNVAGTVGKQLITERITQPSPGEIRAARERARLNQTQAAGLVSPATAAGYKTWSGYEQPVGTRNHRAIPLAAWELFLLLTNQHPAMHLNMGASTGESGE
jgi:hypothetical protein